MALQMSLILSVFLTFFQHFALSANSIGVASKEIYPYKFMTKDASAASAKKYDYIIVGGGTSGCPLAATLSANYSVLVLERGGSPYGNPEIENATLFGAPLGETDKYTSVAQAVPTEDGLTVDRARVLGGGTALNAGFYSRASWDYVKNMGWEKDLVKQSYEWVEKQNAFKPDKLNQWSDAFKSALLEVGIKPYNGYTVDHVEGTKISASTFDNQGKRHTAANLLQNANPDNIVVLLHATASKIIFDDSTAGSKLKALGVEFMDEQGSPHKVYIDETNVDNEVIVSAGSMGSPQLLMLSGVGPAEHLKEFKVPVMKDLPGVGQGIQDSPRSTVALESPMPLEASSIQVVAILNGSNTYIFSSCFVQASTPASTNSSKAAAAQPAVTYLGNMFEKLAFPKSRGEIKLKTLDPRDNPSVRYNYYSHPEDVQRCCDGTRMLAKLMETQTFKKFEVSGTHSDPGVVEGYKYSGPPIPDSGADDSAMVKFCHATLATMWHFHGGCHVGQAVESDYHVIGSSNLRVIDGSTFADGPGTNPQATTLMLGRYMGIKIIQGRSSKA